ncbi:MAG TPA: hypothetical protein V6D17_25350, partial [Candidatus Obscuribacterales bacterium]
MPPYDVAFPNFPQDQSRERNQGTAPHDLIGAYFANPVNAPDFKAFLARDVWAKPFDRVEQNIANFPSRTGDPYRALAMAHETAILMGVPSALGHYRNAVFAADQIDQNAVGRQREANGKQLKDLATAIAVMQRSGRSGAEMQNLLRQKEAAEAEGGRLYGQWIAPAAARANMGMACISTGQDMLVRYGEKLLNEATKMRPEIANDPYYKLHLEEARRECEKNRRLLQGMPQRDLFQWSGDGRPGSPQDRLQPGQKRQPGQYQWPGGDPISPGRRPGDPAVQPGSEFKNPALELRPSPGTFTPKPNPGGRPAEPFPQFRRGKDSPVEPRPEIKYDVPKSDKPQEKEINKGWYDKLDTKEKLLLAAVLAFFGYQVIKRGNRYFAQRVSTEGNEALAKSPEMSEKLKAEVERAGKEFARPKPVRAEKQQKDTEIKIGDKTEKVKAGDWVVRHPDGKVEVVKDADFAGRFKATEKAGEFMDGEAAKVKAVKLPELGELGKELGLERQTNRGLWAVVDEGGQVKLMTETEFAAKHREPTAEEKVAWMRASSEGKPEPQKEGDAPKEGETPKPPKAEVREMELEGGRKVKVTQFEPGRFDVETEPGKGYRYFKDGSTPVVEVPDQKIRFQQEGDGVWRVRQSGEAAKLPDQKQMDLLKEALTVRLAVEGVGNPAKQVDALVKPTQDELSPRDKASAEKAQYEKQIADLQAAQKDLATKLQDAERKAKETEQSRVEERAAREKQIADLQAAQRDLTTKLQDAERKAKETEQARMEERTAREKQIADLQAAQKDLTIRLDEAQRKAKEAGTAFETERAATAKQIADLSAAQKDLTAKLEEAQRQAKTAQETAETAKTGYEKQIADLTALKKELTAKLEEEQRKSKEMATATDEQRAAQQKKVAEMEAAQKDLVAQLEEAQRKAKEAQEAAATDRGARDKQIGDLQKAQQELTARLEEAQRKAAETEKTHQAARQEYEREIAALQNGQKDLSGKLEEAQRKAKESADAAQTERTTYERQIADLKQVQKDLGGKLEEAQRKAKEASDAARTEKAAYEAQISDLQRGQQELTTRLEEAQRKAKEVSETAQSERTAHERQIADMQKQQQELSTKLEEAQRKNQEAALASATEKAALEQQIADLKQAQKDLSGKLEEAQRKAKEASDAARTEKAAYEAQISDLQRGQQELTTKLEEAQRKAKEASETAQSERTAHERQIADMQKQQQELSTKLEEAQRKNQEAVLARATEKAALEQQIADMQKAQQDLAAKLAEAERKSKEALTASATEKAVLEQQIADMQKAQQDLRTKLEQAQSRNKEIEAAAKTERAAHERKVAEMQQAQQELAQKLAGAEREAKEKAGTEKAQYEKQIADLQKAQADLLARLEEAQRKGSAGAPAAAKEIVPGVREGQKATIDGVTWTAVAGTKDGRVVVQSGEIQYGPRKAQVTKAEVTPIAIPGKNGAFFVKEGSDVVYAELPLERRLGGPVVEGASQIVVAHGLKAKTIGSDVVREMLVPGSITQAAKLVET